MHPLWIILILILVTSLTYLNSFPAAFHFDDFPLLLESTRITGEQFPYSSFLDHFGGRPLTLLTFHWNYHLFGNNPFSYHFLSFLLHTLVVVLVFLLVLRLYRKKLLAFVCALVFAIHPLQTQAVNYIWSRSIILMAAFALLSILIWQRYPRIALGVAQLAIWARFEAIVLLIAMLFVKPKQWKVFLFLISFNIMGVLYSLLTYAPQEIGWNHPDPVRFWLLQPFIFWKYMSLMLWPVNLTIDHHVTTPSFWSQFLALLVFGVACGLAVRFRRVFSIPAAGFGWIVLLLAPSLLFPNFDLINESRVYLAFAGFALIISWAFCWYLESQEVGLRWATTLLLFILMAWVTAERNIVWTDDVTLWKDAVAKSPGKARVHYNLGATLSRLKRNEEAQTNFEKALFLDPESDLFQAALGYCAEIKGELDKAQTFYKKALHLNSENTYARQGAERIEQRIKKEREGS